MSYGMNEVAIASSLRGQIERRGVGVLDWAKDIARGDDLLESLRKALEASDALILIVPQTGAAHANNAFFEAGAAKALGKRV